MWYMPEIQSNSQMYFREINNKDNTEFRENFYFWVGEKIKKIKEVKKLFQRSQNWPSFQECKTCCNRPLLCSHKTANSFVLGFQRMFTYLAVGASFLVFFLRNSYFAAVSVIEGSFSIMPFFLFCFVFCWVFFFFFLTLSFIFGYYKVDSFLFDWIQQQKHSTERTKKMSVGMFLWADFLKKKFEIENYSR